MYKREMKVHVPFIELQSSHLSLMTKNHVDRWDQRSELPSSWNVPSEAIQFQ
jgi:hypothetical protein